MTIDPSRVTWDEHTFETEAEAVAYLTEDGGACFSRWGSTSADCAPIAWALAQIYQYASSGEPIGVDDLDGWMSMVVNEHPDVESLIESYGYVVGLRIVDGEAEWYTPT